MRASGTQKLEEMKAQAHLSVARALAWILMIFFGAGLIGADLGSSFGDCTAEDSGGAD